MALSVDCSAETHFGADCNDLLKGRPHGYIIQKSRDLTLKIPYYGLAKDPLTDNCLLCLIRFLDGSAVNVRYPKYDIISEHHPEFKPLPNFYK